MPAAFSAPRVLLPFALAASVRAATPVRPGCAAEPVPALCSCGGSASVGRAMQGAALVAIAVPVRSPGDSAVIDPPTWSLRIERAWKWPGGGDAPPRQIVVTRSEVATACAIRIAPDERQLVVASLRPSDGALVLGHKCATPWGAVDTLGPTARDVRRFGGDVAMRGFAADRARLLDSLQAFGAGTEPAR